MQKKDIFLGCRESKLTTVTYIRDLSAFADSTNKKPHGLGGASTSHGMWRRSSERFLHYMNCPGFH